MPIAATSMLRRHWRGAPPRSARDESGASRPGRGRSAPRDTLHRRRHVPDAPCDIDRRHRPALDNAAPIAEHRPPSANGSPAMTRSELRARVAIATSLSKADAAAAAGVVFSTIADARGETVTIAGFGKFATRDRAARSGRNPHGPARRSPSRRAGRLSSRPARPCATPSTHSVARAIPRNPRPVVAASTRQAYAVAIGVFRCVGFEAPALPCRLRVVDRRSGPCGQQPPAIRFASSAVSPSAAPRRPDSATFVSEVNAQPCTHPLRRRIHALCLPDATCRRPAIRRVYPTA